MHAHTRAQVLMQKGRALPSIALLPIRHGLREATRTHRGMDRGRGGRGFGELSILETVWKIAPTRTTQALKGITEILPQDTQANWGREE